MVIGPDGNLYIADSENVSEDKIDLLTDALITLISGCPAGPFVNPTGVAFGPDGNLYVSDEGNGCGNTGSAVYEYTIGGLPLGRFGDTNVLTDPRDLVFGPDGNLYVTDGEGRVALFNGTTGTEIFPDFVPSNGSAGPLVDPTFLAFSSTTPEPSTMGLIGLGLAAVLLRRRR